MDAFDLEGYLEKYAPSVRAQRALFIAEHAGESPALRQAAYRTALALLEGSLNTAAYKAAADAAAPFLSGAEQPSAASGGAPQDAASSSAAASSSSSSPLFDRAAFEAAEKAAAEQQERLEIELNTAKANLIKESIRVALNDLGSFYVRRGAHASALKHFIKTRDYCSSNKHVLEMCTNVIVSAIALRQYLHVSNYVAKAEATMPRHGGGGGGGGGGGRYGGGGAAAAGSGAAGAAAMGAPTAEGTAEAVLAAQFRAVSGLVQLDAGNYLQAAHKLLGVGARLGASFNEVLHADDVALYGALCAMASFDRDALKRLALDAPAFRELLELHPVARQLLQDFHGSRFAAVVAQLERLRPVLLLDAHLRPHVAKLFAKVRQRALVQYCSPYVSVDLARMAAAFGCATPEALEAEMAALIADGQVAARIDSKNKTMVPRQADQRAEAIARAVALGQLVVRETQSMVLRLNLQKAGFVVKGRGRSALGANGNAFAQMELASAPTAANDAGGGGGGGGGGGVQGTGAESGGQDQSTPPASPAPAQAPSTPN